MGWELDIIKWLQSGSSKANDYIFYSITQLGTEILFMLAAMVFFWCISKKEGFKLINLFMASQIMTGIIKVGVRRTRPYATGKVNAILEKTEGYSFPSGHSNNIAVVATHASKYAKGRSRVIVAAVGGGLVFLVMLSRMYLGQHYLTDVIAGAIIGVAVALLGGSLFELLGDKEEKLVFVVAPCCVLLFIAALIMLIVKGEQLDSLVKVAGTYLTVTVGYYIEKQHVHSTVATGGRRIALRLVIGLIVAVAVMFGLKYLFGLVKSEVAGLVFDFIRYAIIGIWVTLLAPMAFVKLRI